jgi:acetyl esterase/lipase
MTTNLIGYGLKVVGGALSPLLGLLGFAGAVLNRLHHRPLVALLSALGSFLSAGYIRRVSKPHDGFERVFGPAWCERVQARTTPSWRAAMLRWRWQWGATVRRRPRVARDLAFDTVPGEHGAPRRLLCDLWEPAPSVTRSGVGLIYLHGGAWQAFDKDVLTRPFFRHLTSQGHVVMDVAYRLARETDMRGMLGDAKRAIAWFKRQAAAYGVDPERIVIAGGSAGGHLAMLAAYTPNHPFLDPVDVRAADTSVRGVVSYYGVPDLRTLARHWSQQTMHPLAAALGMALDFFPRTGYRPWSKLVRQLFGGPLEEIDDDLLFFSPVAHVGPHCPPTLLLQGLHDHITPVRDVVSLHEALGDAGCRSVMVTLPQVEHAFDLIALPISPPAQAALFDVERFLALVA